MTEFFRFGEERGLFCWAVVVMFSTLALLYAGGMVTSTGSGLAVPDWPLSYGQLFPPLVGGVYFETGHRLVAKLVGIFTILLAVWLWRSRVGRTFRVIRLLGPIAVVAVLFQGLLGGITVIYLLPSPVSILHAVTGQTFFCLMVAIAYVTSSAPNRPAGIAVESKFSRLLLSLTALVFCQLILGAVYRHTGALIWLHAATGVVIGITALFLLFHSFGPIGAPESRNLTIPVRFLSFIILLQIFLGISAWYIRNTPAAIIPPPILHTSLRTLHQTIGGLILGASFWFSLSLLLGPILKRLPCPMKGAEFAKRRPAS